MWTILVVLHPPLLDLSPCLLYTLKPVLIQALFPQLPVEALYVPILHRFSGPDEFQLDPFFIGPPALIDIVSYSETQSGCSGHGKKMLAEGR
jgi:hypothetical protein